MKRSQWFGSMEIDSSLASIEREVTMWRAVIDQAIEDMLNTDDTKEARLNRLRARLWLTERNASLEEVCYLAQIPIEVVMSGIKYIMETKNEEENSSPD